jgi:hypothetical protein
MEESDDILTHFVQSYILHSGIQNSYNVTSPLETEDFDNQVNFEIHVSSTQTRHFLSLLMRLKKLYNGCYLLLLILLVHSLRDNILFFFRRLGPDWSEME